MEHDTRHPDHGDGLHEDLVKLASRRDALRIFGAGGATAILTTLGRTRTVSVRLVCRFQRTRYVVVIDG